MEQNEIHTQADTLYQQLRNTPNSDPRGRSPLSGWKTPQDKLVDIAGYVIFFAAIALVIMWKAHFFASAMFGKWDNQPLTHQAIVHFGIGVAVFDLSLIAVRIWQAYFCGATASGPYCQAAFDHRTRLPRRKRYILGAMQSTEPVVNAVLQQWINKENRPFGEAQYAAVRQCVAKTDQQIVSDANTSAMTFKVWDLISEAAVLYLIFFVTDFANLLSPFSIVFLALYITGIFTVTLWFADGPIKLIATWLRRKLSIHAVAQPA